jgi:hypothetical protein
MEKSTSEQFYEAVDRLARREALVLGVADHIPKAPVILAELERMSVPRIYGYLGRALENICYG